MIDTEKLMHIRDTILYRNADEKKNAYRQCIEYLIKHDEYCSSFSADELEHLLNNPDGQTDDNRAEWTFHDYLSLDEGAKLFELACQKYGYKLWNGNAWHNKTCKRNCPLADFCERNTVEINGERLCRGQVYSRDISWEDLPQDTLIYKQDGSPYLTKKQDDQSFSDFFEFSIDISEFGWEKRGGSQITGGNVILKLYKEALNSTANITTKDMLIDKGFDADVVSKMKVEEAIKADSIENWYEKELYMAKITEKYGETMYIDPKAIAQYNSLRAQFDIVVHIIQEKFHIRCTNAFWKEVLQTYLINRVFCDTEVTEYSLPCTFALRALRQHSCLGQQFEVDSEVFQAISKYPCVAWVDVPDEGYKMLQYNENDLQLVFRSYNYQRKVVDGKNIIESLNFCIDDNNSLKTIYEKKTEFDETYFTNILNSEKGKNVWDQDLLDIAAELMPPLI